MENIDTLITMASWEERFKLGLIKFINQSEPKNLVVFYIKEYESWTAENRLFITTFCQNRNIPVTEIELLYTKPDTSYLIIHQLVTQKLTSGNSILVDISTMPREIIWTIIHLLNSASNTISYLYNSPEKYNNEWLSRDPGRPRIVFKLGGITEIGLPTNLLIISGYDIERIKQLIYFYEPSSVLLGIQRGRQFGNEDMNINKCRKAFYGQPGIHIFEVDAYSQDHGYSIISEKLNEFINDSNIIMSSLGPKLSAISLYRIHANNSRTALAYAPSNDFNLNYSVGLGDTYSSVLKI